MKSVMHITYVIERKVFESLQNHDHPLFTKNFDEIKKHAVF